MIDYKTNNELLIYLWNRCNNRCTFCYNQTLYHLPLNIKEHLQICNDMLNSTFMENFNYLRLLGGELFDGSIDQLGIRDEFFKILETCIKLIKEGKLDKLNFLTNLIYADNKDLRDTLNELVAFSNISNAALPEIETMLSNYMMEMGKDKNDDEQ